MNLDKIGVLTCGMFAALSVMAVEPAALDSHLEPLRPLLEKTWQGTFHGPKPDQPTVDVMRWERALNGRAVRILHSINDGVYGGETLLFWDREKQTVTFYYFATADFMTVGTMTFKDGRILTHEKVAGSGSAVTDVRGIAELREDGSFHVKTEHLKDGTWSTGHEVTYRPAPQAKVQFR